MPTTGDPEQRFAFLEDEAASRWFNRLREGPAVLDRHLTHLVETFGEDVPFRMRAAIDPRNKRPSVLVLEVMLPIDDGEAWERLIALQALLLAEEDDLRGITKRAQPFGRIIVTLGGPPADWDRLASELERGF